MNARRIILLLVALCLAVPLHYGEASLATRGMMACCQKTESVEPACSKCAKEPVCKHASCCNAVAIPLIFSRSASFVPLGNVVSSYQVENFSAPLRSEPPLLGPPRLA